MNTATPTCSEIFGRAVTDMAKQGDRIIMGLRLGLAKDAAGVFDPNDDLH